MKKPAGYSLNELIKLRKTIHKNPELAGNEESTARRIIAFAKNFAPDKIIPGIGGNGLAVIFEGKQKGPTVLIRCELDALPIAEINKFGHKSVNSNVSHKCGHDGHMTIVSGLIPLLSKNRIGRGRVVLLYQPAEETGEGAEWVLKDKKFSRIKPEYVFALHNLPGYEKGQILVRDREFAAASKGIIIKLTGKTSHAAEPEKGINPASAVSEIISGLGKLPGNIRGLKDFSLVTIIHAKIGERAFGTSPGYAEVMATLRTFKNDDMQRLTREAVKLIKKISGANRLKTDISFTEEFPATVSDPGCVKLVRNAARENGLKIRTIKKPFRWSEDFGHFTGSYKGALFGLGSGRKQPALHNPDYDFPDDIIKPGTSVFYSIITQILE